MEDTQEQRHLKPVPKAASSAAHRQCQSDLFRRLPPEVRHMIYSHLFDSTRISWGKRMGSIEKSLPGINIRPARNSLALLRTCRLINAEIGSTWVSRVLFSFEHTEAMLDKLTALPPGFLSKVRRVRVRGHVLCLDFGRPGNSRIYGLAAVLRLLPGLRLDTLTVLGQHYPRESYGTLDSLICESSGWKELRYISHSSGLMGFAEQRSMPRALIELEERRYTRKPQPAYWQGIMEARDGAGTKPLVTIYRSTVQGLTGSVLNPATRYWFDQGPYDVQARPGFGKTPKTELMRDNEQRTEVMVVVRRGVGVDYEEKADAELLDNDIRVDAPDETWQEIRQRHYHGLFPQNPNVKEPTEIDAYESAEQYVWPQWFFLSSYPARGVTAAVLRLGLVPDAGLEY